MNDMLRNHVHYLDNPVLLNKQLSILGAVREKILHAPSQNSLQKYRYYMVKKGITDKLFVFFTGIPAIGHFENPYYFEWCQFAQTHLAEHNWLFVRDSNNFWYLDPSDIYLMRSEVLDLIESIRLSLSIPRPHVIGIGCSAGATAAVDVVSVGIYGKAVSFSAQLDFLLDTKLMEQYGETFRPRYSMERQILSAGHYPNLLPSFLFASSASQFLLVWGRRNVIDNTIHVEIETRLSQKIKGENFHFIPIDTEEHNSAALFNQLTLRDHLLQK
jgi:hypothetical protein